MGLKKLRGTDRILGDLSRLQTTIAHETARKAGPLYSQLTKTAHENRQSVYGGARLNDDGEVLSLERTGRMISSLKHVVYGRTIRVILGTPYAKYHIRRGLLPNGPIPRAWAAATEQLLREVEAKR